MVSNTGLRKFEALNGYTNMCSAGLKHSLVTAAAPSSDPGVGMWQGSGCPSKVGGFPWVLQFPPPCTIVNIRAYENAFIRCMSFLCNRSKINSVYTF